MMNIDQARKNGQSIIEPLAELEAACKESMSYASSIAVESWSSENWDGDRDH